MSRERPNTLPLAVAGALAAPNNTNNHAVHRHTADSKRGRQIMAASSTVFHGPGLSAEQQQWNAEIEAKRQAKLERRRGRNKDAACPG